MPSHAAAIELHAGPATTSRPAAEARAVTGTHAAGELSFESIYDRYFDDVVRWLRALGAPPADREDLAQEVFLVVRRRLHAFDGRNLAGWLYRISARQVMAYRRRRWFRSVVSREPGVQLEELPDTLAGPAGALELREEQRVLRRLLDKLADKRRATFVLFEIEGYSGEEIAAIQGIPVATVWTRLHHARKEFFALVDEHRRAEEMRG